MLRKFSSVLEAISPRRTTKNDTTREPSSSSQQQQQHVFHDVEAHLHSSDTSRRRLSEHPRFQSSSLEESNQTSTTLSPPTSHRRIVEEAPKSRVVGGLPLMTPEPRLLHPFLNHIPLHVRFGINGLLSNILFMIAYNAAVHFLQKIPAPTIYSTVYLCFIPLQHLMTSLLVFGWPDRYVPSLMSNVPIGLTAIALGSVLTAYLDKYQFNEQIEDWIRNNFTFSHMPARTAAEKSEFYSSLLVLFVTSIWTYILSVCINSPATVSDKKEL